MTAHQFYGHISAYGGKAHRYELPLSRIFPGAAVQAEDLEHKKGAYRAWYGSHAQSAQEAVDGHVLNGEIHAQHNGQEGGQIDYYYINKDYSQYPQLMARV